MQCVPNSPSSFLSLDNNSYVFIDMMIIDIGLTVQSQILNVLMHSAIGKNQPLRKEHPKWKSDVPLTEGQLRSKRDEFWDTAPAFDGNL